MLQYLYSWSMIPVVLEARKYFFIKFFLVLSREVSKFFTHICLTSTPELALWVVVSKQFYMLFRLLSWMKENRTL